MTQDPASNEKEKGIDSSPLFHGKPVRVLSTSLGIALLANAFLVPGTPVNSASSSDEPQLVSWSTEEVKQYFDKNVDWNIPLPDLEKKDGDSSGTSSTGGSGSGGTTVINNYGGYNSGFGWDDILLYHMLFNSGSYYSSSRWYNTHPGYYPNTNRSYRPSKSYSSTTFQNKSVTGSRVGPKTSSTSKGTITRRSSSSSSGGIGGKSSGLGSSSSSSSSSRSSGFGG
ncbi:hypothetical protein J2Z69_002529 [Paenibacillus shirakamiensis]|uniref:Uncharacterized protein n=1 Tax=Paenibacillus shirakamiensis TaxID=1265935 RepID=A0ABS4JID9_9BACL|nr:hypothetical protein [Paenibacillus shirakamiensis]